MSLALQQYETLAAVPFQSPHKAAAALLAKLDVKQQAALAFVTLDGCGLGTEKKRVTMVLRDMGCGMTNTSVPRTIFQAQREAMPPSDPLKLRVLYVTSSTSLGAVQLGVDRARANHEWIILVFHRLDIPRARTSQTRLLRIVWI